MSIKELYSVEQIPPQETHQWLLHKHYARRIPSISYSFGLYYRPQKYKMLVGIITFGMPPNYVEMMAWKPYELLELNRLVVNEGLEKNICSFFIMNSIKLLPQPRVLISYSDFRQGHHGYIYQATNWIYTGVGGEGQKIYMMKDGTERHQRHEDMINPELVDHIELTTGKARYYMFHGNRRDKEKMGKLMRFEKHPYPKGDNSRYDSGNEVATQTTLF